MTISLDMTPTVFNRTAIFHIALDTARAWEERVRLWRYGERYHESLLTDTAQLAGLSGEVIPLVLGDEGLARESGRPFGQRRARAPAAGRMLFFDPLYGLIDEIRPGDVALVLDLSPVTNPEWHGGRIADLYHAAFARLLSSGARVLAISHHTAMSLWANYGWPPDRTEVIPLYLRQGVTAVRAAAAEPEKRFLFVGSLEVRKNIAGLLLGFERSRLGRRGYTLSVAGGGGNGAEQVRFLASTMTGVELCGFVPDDALKDLYARSLGFVYPSFLEGFGVPVLEAMAAGLPVMVGTTGAAPEIAGADAIVVDPYDVDAIARGFLTLADMTEQERRQVAAAGQRRAAGFTFERYLGALDACVFDEPPA
jgi:glycosyltransferase involved in cell wall biosynthesis